MMVLQGTGIGQASAGTIGIWLGITALVVCVFVATVSMRGPREAP